MVDIVTTKAHTSSDVYPQRTTRDASPLVAQALGTTTSAGRNDPSLASRLPGTEAGATTETDAGQVDSTEQGAAASEAAWTSQSGCSGCGCGCAGDSNSPEAGSNDGSAGFDQESITPPVSDSIEPVE